MYKIKLILADPDSRYVDKVAAFINSSFLLQVKVVAYTKVTLLQDYLRTLTDKVDVLLVNPEFLVQVTGLLEQIDLVMILSDGNINYRLEEYQSVNKYQPGDRLLHQLLNIYAEQNINVTKLVTGSNLTKLVAVYSPTGGVGKTSVALGLASKLSDLGLSVFCLSLESISSLTIALHCQGNDAMTHILLSLQEHAELLAVKAEMYKTRDYEHGIDFFEPPQCFLEQAELKEELLSEFLEQLRQLGRYDVVVIDMETVLDQKAITIFTKCDQIVLVQAPELVCKYKIETFLKQLWSTGINEQSGFGSKVVPLINKYMGGAPANLSQYGLSTKYSIPFFPQLWTYQQGKYAFDAGRNFSNCLANLARQLM